MWQKIVGSMFTTIWNDPRFKSAYEPTLGISKASWRMVHYSLWPNAIPFSIDKITPFLREYVDVSLSQVCFRWLLEFVYDLPFTSLSDPLPLPLGTGILDEARTTRAKNSAFRCAKQRRRLVGVTKTTSLPWNPHRCLYYTTSHEVYSWDSILRTETKNRWPSSEDHRSRSFTHRIDGNKRPPSKFKVFAKTTDYFNRYFDSPALELWEDQSIHPDNQSVDSATSIRGKQSYTISGCCC